MERSLSLPKADLRTRIAVCIPTYKRPEGLRRLLLALARQESIPDGDVTIIVIDNEGSPATKTLCDSVATKLTFKVIYCTEPRRGLSHVRNRAVAAARLCAEFLVFIDDDEVPSPGWLNSLRGCQSKYFADVVAGPVVPYFTSSVPRWIQDGRYFHKGGHETGAVLKEASTSNVLIRMEVFDRIGSFDDRFALTGGEDSDFFIRAHAFGVRMIWANEAEVEEWIPSSRATMKWLLMRSFRVGSTAALRDRRSPMRENVVVCVMRATISCLKGIVMLPLSGLRGRSASVKRLQRVFHAAGMIFGVLGLPYEEYRKIHPV
jgi:glycosyltransferase involved in cell wall biosynthesis